MDRSCSRGPEGTTRLSNTFSPQSLQSFKNRPDNHKSPELLLLEKLRKVHDRTVDCRKHFSQKLKRKLTSTEH